jgi:hypothetical protein
MMPNPRARISRSNTSWMVRVPGHRTAFFADGKHGGTDAALAAAQAWRDEHWDGVNRRYEGKLTPEQRAEIIISGEPASVLAARYGVSRQYVWNLRSKNRRG